MISLFYKGMFFLPFSPPIAPGDLLDALHVVVEAQFYTFLQSVMDLVMLPRPATSTTFSCQLNSTLMAVPVDSFTAPGRPETWLKPPVACGVILLEARPGVRCPLLEDTLIPLYLCPMVNTVGTEN